MATRDVTTGAGNDNPQVTLRVPTNEGPSGPIEHEKKDFAADGHVASRPTSHAGTQNSDGHLVAPGDAAASAPNSRPASIRPPSAIHAATQITFTDPDFTKPPPLNYTLQTRKKAIAIFWGLVILDVVCMPIALYFGLWYGTSLSHNAVFSISTGALGSVSIFEYFLRFWRLWRKGSTCRVIGARRWYLDWFHWNLSVGWIGVMLELIIGTVPAEPPIRLLAMPMATMCYAIGTQMLIIDIMRFAGLRSPVRISSLPAGSPLRPGIYSFIEDVVAVDGSGGTEFRQRLNLRYQASHKFREMLHRLTLFWAIGAIGIAVVTTILVFTIEKDAAYVVSTTHSTTINYHWHIANAKYRSAGSFQQYGLASGHQLPLCTCSVDFKSNTEHGAKIGR